MNRRSEKRRSVVSPYVQYAVELLRQNRILSALCKNRDLRETNDDQLNARRPPQLKEKVKIRRLTASLSLRYHSQSLSHIAAFNSLPEPGSWAELNASKWTHGDLSRFNRHQNMTFDSFSVPPMPFRVAQPCRCLSNLFKDRDLDKDKCGPITSRRPIRFKDRARQSLLTASPWVQYNFKSLRQIAVPDSPDIKNSSRTERDQMNARRLFYCSCKVWI